jgi:putative MATE family efflux protein
MYKNFKLRALLTDIKDSLSGTERDFTTGSISRAVTILAIPMVLELSMQAVFGVIDVFFVAKLGGKAVATVGITESLLTIVFSIATGLAMGTTALVARRIGERNKQGATTAAVQSIFLGILVSIPIAAIGLLYTPSLLRLMGASHSVVEIGAGYNKVMLGGNLTIMLLFLINAIFRGTGDAALAMRALWIANLVNIVLDPCLIFGLGPFPEMGVTGAAVATNVARAIGILYQIWKLASPASRIQVHARDLEIDKKVLLNLSKISLGGILQFIVATASWLGLVRIIAVFGSPALAGYTIAIRIIIFAILPSWGMSNAAATLVGQNLGAEQPTRAEKSVWLTAVANMVFLGFITIVFVTFADTISRLFTSDEEILVYAVSCLKYVSYGYVFYAYGMVVVQAFNGAGDTYTPTIINLFCYWLLQIPLAYILALTIGLEAQGVFIAIAVSESLLAVVSVLVFRRGKWKERKV